MKRKKLATLPIDPQPEITESQSEHNAASPQKAVASKPTDETTETSPDPQEITVSHSREITQAEADQLVQKINESYAYIMKNTKNHILFIDHNATDQAQKYDFIPKQSFKDWFIDTKVLVTQTKKIPLGDYWFTHSKRKKYHKAVFNPGEVSDNSVFNLYQGFGVPRKAGKCPLLLDHIKEIICDGNLEHYEYLMYWLGHIVQYPGEKMRSSVLLLGKQGTGKGVLGKTMLEIFYPHSKQITQPDQLVNKFNAHLHQTLFLFFDEANLTQNKNAKNILKGLITEDKMMLESKGIDASQVQNYLQIMMASNSEHAIPIEIDDRRFFVLQVSDKRMKDQPYFDRLHDELDHGGREAFLDHLLNLDVGKSLPIPKTEALQIQQIYSLGPVESELYEILNDGRLLPNHDGWNGAVLKDDFVKYLKNIAVQNGKPTDVSESILGKILKKSIPSLNTEHRLRIVSKESKTRPHAYKFPPLETCRREFEANFSSPLPWNQPGTETGEYFSTQNDQAA